MLSDLVIDVSDAQGPSIDWPTVAAAGIVLAFVKASEGSTFKAHTFIANVKGATASGLLTVPYTFLRPGFADAEVDNFVEAADLKTGSPFMLDWEGRAADTCTPEAAQDIADELTQITGREPIWYFGLPFSTPRPPTQKMLAGCRFIPRYPASGIRSFDELRSPLNDPAQKVPGAMLWQYTASGRVSGIAGPVDRSVWLGTADELKIWISTGQRPAWALPPDTPAV